MTTPETTMPVALVTGGASGIGLAIVQRLARDGARVIMADIDEARAHTEAATIKNARAIRLDVTSDDEWRAAMTLVDAEYGRLDTLVNNAGVVHVGDVESIELADWHRVQAINVDGVFLGCRHGIGIMKRTGGAIVNMSSISGIIGTGNLIAYNASKGAVRLLTKSVALHCARKGYGIRANSVHPAFVETAMLDEYVAARRDPDAALAQMKGFIPLGRFATVTEVASLVAYLASAEAAFITGAEYVIDGGATAQ